LQRLAGAYQRQDIDHLPLARNGHHRLAHLALEENFTRHIAKTPFGAYLYAHIYRFFLPIILIITNYIKSWHRAVHLKREAAGIRRNAP
jgi:hypothetical protein